MEEERGGGKGGRRRWREGVRQVGEHTVRNCACGR